MKEGSSVSSGRVTLAVIDKPSEWETSSSPPELICSSSSSSSASSASSSRGPGQLGLLWIIRWYSFNGLTSHTLLTFQPSNLPEIFERALHWPWSTLPPWPKILNAQRTRLVLCQFISKQIKELVSQPKIQPLSLSIRDPARQFQHNLPIFQQT